MSDHIAGAGQMPPDGFYYAKVQCDTGGEIGHHVRVKDGIPHTPSGAKLLPSACSGFEPLTTQAVCLNWPLAAAMEIDTLRSANAGLVDRVRRLEAAIRAMHGCIHGGRFAAMSADEIISGKAAL